MTNIYKESIFSTNIQLRPNEYNQSINETLLEKLKKKVEGKCDKNGFIKPGSADILRRSIGTIQQSQFNGYCSFKVWYKVSCCNPVEGMVINAVAKNVTKAGIRAEVGDTSDESVSSPMVIFVSRDHHAQSKSFNDVNVNDEIQVRIIGVRFVLNDKYISAIAQLVDKPKHNADKNIKKKPKLVIKN